MDDLKQLRDLIASDAHAMSFQSIGQYRTAMLRQIDSLAARRQPDAGVVVGYRIEMRAGDYSFMEAKHWSYNGKHYAGSRVHELILGKCIQNPGVPAEVAAVFPSLWKGVRPDTTPPASPVPASVDLDGLHRDIMNLPVLREPNIEMPSYWYRRGHKEARHAAAELVSALASQPVEVVDGGDIGKCWPTERTFGAVRVCPERDIECGNNLKAWCATCPNRKGQNRA